MHPVAIIPEGSEPQPRRELFDALRRIDGWGPGAWREVFGLWRLSCGLLAINDREGDGEADAGACDAVLVLADQRLLAPRDAGDEAATTATADWVLRRTWTDLIADSPITCGTYQPGATIRMGNACWFARATLHLRLAIDLPFAGMCCDSPRFARFLRRLERFARNLCRRPSTDLRRHVASVRCSRALRAALPGHGLVAFLAEGALLARAADGSPLPGCAPLCVPRSLRTTIDCGRFGRFHGLGIRRGVTAVAGAPYHGKSTLLSALMAGREDHPPGDGRELVVSDPSVIRVQAEDGRRIKATDLSWYFPRLPASDATAFATVHASGATSMAAGVVQGVAAGCRLLLVDEDSAAGNFLHLDPGMRALLGRDLAGFRTLVDALPHLAAQGVSTVLVAGAHLATLAAAERVVVMGHFQPADGTRRVARLLGTSAGRQRMMDSARRRSRTSDAAIRILHDHPDCILGLRHFLAVDATEPERPRLGGLTVDLRRSGWHLDAALVRGALCAAAWCCRLATGHAVALPELQRRYEGFIVARGARGLDPFDTLLLTVPPWPLVAAVLERLPRPVMERHGEHRS